MSQQEEKIKEIIRELAADFFSRESNRTSLITITGIDLRSRGSKAIILFTVLPEDQETQALEFMHRRLTDFREHVMSHSRLFRIPYFEVAIDIGEKNRRKLDELAKTL